MQAIDHAAQSLQNHYWCFDTLLKKKNKMQREFSEFNVKKKRLNCWQAFCTLEKWLRMEKAISDTVWSKIKTYIYITLRQICKAWSERQKAFNFFHHWFYQIIGWMSGLIFFVFILLCFVQSISISICVTLINWILWYRKVIYCCLLQAPG